MTQTVRIMLINGPNLNMLGLRQPEIYGAQSLTEIEQACRHHAKQQGVALTCLQSNHEGQLVEWVQQARDHADGIVINPGAYSHTSIALLDAVMSAETPLIEVHLSNIHARESFRHHSYLSQAALAVICGLGSKGYLMAIEALAEHIRKKNAS